MRIIAFQSHPIQHFTPLWAELSRRPGVTLKVCYYSRHALQASHDPEFGIKIAWDVDLLGGHEHEFLPRRWPTTNPNEYTWKGLNRGIRAALDQGWDAAYVAGWVHLNNWAVLRAAKRRGIPVMMHSDASILTAYDNRGSVRLGVKRLLLGNFLRRLGGGMGLGDHAREFLIHYGLAPERAFIVPLPVDVARFRERVASASLQELRSIREKYRIPDGKRIITFSGKLIDRKRPQDLVDALARLKRDDVVGVLIGEGPLRASIEAQQAANVIITGFVNQAEMPLLTGLGEISVMPSSYDAHPLSVTESLCLGIPVVQSDLCGTYGPNDVLRDGEDGFVYKCGDVAALADRLARLLDDRALYQRMSARARELSDTQSPVAAADAMLRVAESMQASRKPAGAR